MRRGLSSSILKHTVASLAISAGSLYLQTWLKVRDDFGYPFRYATPRLLTPTPLTRQSNRLLFFGRNSDHAWRDLGTKHSNSQAKPLRPRPTLKLPARNRILAHVGPMIQYFFTMCTTVKHRYSCGHVETEVAPCAASKGVADGKCGVLKVKQIPHAEGCDRCGG